MRTQRWIGLGGITGLVGLSVLGANGGCGTRLTEELEEWQEERAESQLHAAWSASRTKGIADVKQAQSARELVSAIRRGFVVMPKEESEEERAVERSMLKRGERMPQRVVTPFLGTSAIRTLSRGSQGLRAELETQSIRHLKRATVELPESARDALVVRDGLDNDFMVEASLENASEAKVEQADGYAVYRGGYRSGARLLDMIQRVTDEGAEDYVVYPSAPEQGKLSYRIKLGKKVAGMRLVSNTLELLDASGTPRLRMPPPKGMGADGKAFDARIAIENCAYDQDPRAPWGRTVTAPGSAMCTVHVSFDTTKVAYPAVLDPAWYATGSMITARGWHAGVLLGNGRVLAAGGYGNPAFSVVSASELYDRATGTWAATGAMPAGNAVVAEGYVLPAGAALGAGNVVVLGSNSYVARYDVAAGTWAGAPTIPQMAQNHGQYYGTVQMPNGNIYAAVTSSGGGALGTVHEMYNVVTNTWEPKAAVPDGGRGFLYRRNLQPLPGNKYAILGGTGNRNVLIYDTAMDSWTVSGAAFARSYTITTTQFLPNTNKILIASGGGSETYDYVANTVQDLQTTNAPGGSENDSILAADGTVITLGGTADRGFRVYTPADNSWTTLTQTPGNVPISDFPRMLRFSDGALISFGGSETVDGPGRADAFILGCRRASESSDCGANNYCNDGGNNGAISACVPKLANGDTIPNTAPFAGVCSVATAARVCLSGTCSTADNKCGIPNGGTATTAAECRSGAISVTGKCMPAGGCLAEGDCNTATQWCNISATTCTAKIANNGGMPTDTGHGTSPTLNGTCNTAAGALVCQAAVCETSDNRCGLANGTTCTGAAQCRANACFAGDNKCGLPAGQACTVATECRSNDCEAGGFCAGDTDGDGVSDGIEVALGTDPTKKDSDGDGIPDNIELSAGQAGTPPYSKVDSDGDGKIDALDTDDDGDGVLTQNELGTGGGGNPRDTDGDGKKDYLDTDDDNDTILTKDEVGTGASPVDTDGDGKADFIDEDDDGDTLPTKTELNGATPAASADLDGDGKKDYLDSDDDGDGVATKDELGAGGFAAAQDTDGDGKKDFQDTDDDGDGVATKDELGSGGGASPQDTDSDGKKDYLDTDDDGDTLLTKDELGSGGGASPQDTDGDGKKDFQDADDDNDAIPTKTEIEDATRASLSDDVDGDSKKNWLDTDADGDDILDSAEPKDLDNDGIPQYLQKGAAGAIGGSLEGGGCSSSGSAPLGTAVPAFGMMLGLAMMRRRKRSL